jgi:light-regulated signal transduction histidine kinase (bacteriophytochrome)
MVLSVIFVIFLTFIIFKSITSRISKLVNLSENLAEGKFDLSKTYESKDELRPLEESLRLTATRLNEAFLKITTSNQELDQFGYVVSHDLKAPLRAMSSLASWIEEDMGKDIPKEVSNHISLLKSRIIRMEGLINGLLEYSRIGKANIEYEYVQISTLLQNIISDLPLNHSVKINIQKDMPEIYAPKLRLGQVFQNLIDNSIRYGKCSNPQIDITFDEFDKYFQFTVADNGPGIDPLYHEKIFVIFQTLEARDKIESTGIGLSIVKKVLEDIGGGIQVESEPGKGAKFIFQWPKIQERKLNGML